MPNEIDCRGLACPAPVLNTKRLIENQNPDVVKVTVDNEAGRQNVTRFLETQNFKVSVEMEGELFHITGSKDKGSDIDKVEASPDEAEKKKIMVMVTNNLMGHGDNELGSKLIKSFLNTLNEMGEELWRLVFVNNGVKLTIEESEVLPTLNQLEENGIYIMVCGTCLTHFDLLDRKKAGETTNMLDIVTAMQLADKVITL